MSRSVSNAFKGAVFRSQTSEVFLVLITINHNDLVDPIRLTSDNVNTVSNSNTFLQAPFQITLPDDTAESPPSARIVFDNVDRTIVQTIRSLTSSPTVDIQIVLASSPDVIEYEQSGLVLRNADYDVLTVSGELRGIEILDEPFPKDRFTPDNFPAMF